ncbi:MAG: asparagine synthase (glutamine-hydrolyzing) [Anaerolineae bacterium]|nr:asparagine synthase (glutamine-hydrolyzing) [Anaerolineae bacterium]
MCGIVGVYNLRTGQPVRQVDLDNMLAMLRHRGPDEMGTYLDAPRVGLGNARLAIIDLSSGQQPISNETETVWIVYNGEAFNYVELMADLKARGHDFATASDTEVVVHLYEENGPDCVAQLNGQFGFALWDSRDDSLMLARDRVGIRPVFYTVADGQLIFASEIKAIAAHPAVSLELDPVALDQVFTFWSTLGSRTAFKDIYALPPGHVLVARDGEIAVRPYWSLRFPEAGAVEDRPLADWIDEFHHLLRDAVELRFLRSDVTVAAYLSGGIDSSATTAYIKQFTDRDLHTFSITFADPDYDESAYQYEMADFFGTEHHIVRATNPEIGAAFPEAVWHAETPILRTAPAPMYLLSRLVREHGIKVVVTGEGADEVLAGYDIFKEDAIRRFWARDPDSQMRPALLRRLYPYIPAFQRGGGLMATFFKQGLTDTGDPLYSHLLRWSNGTRLKRLFSPDLIAQIGARDTVGEVRGMLPPGFDAWAPLSRAQWLETTIFMSQYLLAAQGDRPAMANSVEGRFPFLDYRLIEFAARVPPKYKLNGLTEKFLLKRAVRDMLPAPVVKRYKQAYRAPIRACFFGADAPAWVRETLAPAAVDEAGYFLPAAVEGLARKAERGELSETDGMALVGVLSTQLIYQQYCQSRPTPDTSNLPWRKRIVAEPA